jgi:hypothetical protein
MDGELAELPQPLLSLEKQLLPGRPLQVGGEGARAA